MIPAITMRKSAGRFHKAIRFEFDPPLSVEEAEEVGRKLQAGDEDLKAAVLTNLSDLGRVGYEAYATDTGGKTFDGRDMPQWGDLPERIQHAWKVAANAIFDEAT